MILWDWERVWGVWEGRDALTCFLGEVELWCTQCGSVAGLHMGIVECRRGGLGLGIIQCTWHEV